MKDDPTSIVNVRLSLEYHEEYTDIMKMVRRSRSRRKKLFESKK